MLKMVSNFGLILFLVLGLGGVPISINFVEIGVGLSAAHAASQKKADKGAKLKDDKSKLEKTKSEKNEVDKVKKDSAEKSQADAKKSNKSEDAQSKADEAKPDKSCSKEDLVCNDLNENRQSEKKTKSDE